jgi:hypothetical protein
MTPRTILILALRILAFWCLIGAVTGISSAAVITYQYAAMFLAGQGAPPLRSNYYSNYGVAIYFVQPVLLLVVAAILGLCAPGIASFYYRKDEPAGVQTSSLTLAAVYRIVIQGLGVVTCLRAVAPIAQFIVWWGQWGGARSLGLHELPVIAEAFLFVVAGGLLIVFAGTLARWATMSRRAGGTGAGS